MNDKRISRDLENPTLALKVSKLLSKSSNRDLRDEQVHHETINRLKGNPIQILGSDTNELPDWTTLQLVQSFNR